MPLPQISMSGTVVAQPELRFTSSGKAVVSLRVATNQRKKTEAGGWVDGDSCFLDVSAWEDKAESIAEQVEKGSRVLVTGTLRQRQFEDREGNKRSAFEVQAYDVALVVQRPKADRDKPAKTGTDLTADPWATPASSTEPPF